MAWRIFWSCSPRYTISSWLPSAAKAGGAWLDWSSMIPLAVQLPPANTAWRIFWSCSPRYTISSWLPSAAKAGGA
jgi:hypothetical protein